MANKGQTLDKINIQVTANTTDAQKNIGRLIGSIKELQDGLNKVDIASRLETIEQTLKGAGKSASTAEDNFEGISQSLKDLVKTADLAQLKLEGLYDKLGKDISKGASKDIISNRIKSIRKLEEEIEKAKEAERAMYAVVPYKSYPVAEYTPRETATQAEATLLKLPAIVDKVNAKLATIGDTIKMQFGGVGKGFELGAYIGEAESSAEAFGEKLVNEEEKANRFKDAIQKIIPILSAFANGLKKVGSALLSVAGGIGKGLWQLTLIPFKRLISNVSAFALGIKRLASQFKRILTYRAIREIFGQIARGFSEGVSAVYQYSNAVGGSFAKNMDSATTSLKYMTNSIGSAVAPILNMLIPALNVLIDKFVSLINVINQTFSLLSGSGSWTKAIKQETKFAEATEGASKAQQSLSAGIDELNVLSQNSGAGGGASTDVAGAFGEESAFGDFATRIKEAIESQNFAGLGVLLAEKLNSIVDKINATAIGKTIGTKLNNAFITATNFLKNVNAFAIGTKISDFINSVFGSIDFNNAGILFTEKYNKLIELIRGFVTNLGWSDMGTDISNFLVSAFTNFDFGQLFATASDIVTGALDFVISFITSTDWSQLGSTIWQKIVDMVTNINWIEIATKVFTLVGSALQATASLLTGFIFAIAPNIEEPIINTWNKIVGIFDTAKAIIVGFWNDTISPLWENNLKPAIDGLGEAISNLWNIVIKPVADLIGTALSTLWNAVLAPLASFIGGLFLGTIKSTFSTIGGVISTSVTLIGSLIASVMQIFDGLITYLTGVFKGDWEMAWEGIKDVFKGVANGIISIFEGVCNFIIDGINFVIGSISNITEDIGEAIGIDLTLSKIDKITLPRLAEGGFVNSGQLFMAREAGAEMVGSIGGRTAVMNNDQIVQAVSSGVYSAVVSALGNRSEGNQNFNLYISGKQVEAEVRRTKQRRGATIGTGGLVNGVY